VDIDNSRPMSDISIKVTYIKHDGKFYKKGTADCSWVVAGVCVNILHFNFFLHFTSYILNINIYKH